MGIMYTILIISVNDSDSSKVHAAARIHFFVLRQCTLIEKPFFSYTFQFQLFFLLIGPTFLHIWDKSFFLNQSCITKFLIYIVVHDSFRKNRSGWTHLLFFVDVYWFFIISVLFKFVSGRWNKFCLSFINFKYTTKLHKSSCKVFSLFCYLKTCIHLCVKLRHFFYLFLSYACLF